MTVARVAGAEHDAGVSDDAYLDHAAEEALRQPVPRLPGAELREVLDRYVEEHGLSLRTERVDERGKHRELTGLEAAAVLIRDGALDVAEINEGETLTPEHVTEAHHMHAIGSTLDEANRAIEEAGMVWTWGHERGLLPDPWPGFTPAPAIVPPDDAELKRVLGGKVAVARKRLGMSQGDLAEQFGKSKIWLRRVEAGSLWAPHGVLTALAVAIGESVGWFYPDTELGTEVAELTDVERLELVAKDLAQVITSMRRTEGEA